MKKTLKVFFCVVAIMAIITCNVCATWANETPYFNTEVDLMFTENIRSMNSTELLAECVDNAYELGLFGGAVPIACIVAENDTLPNGYEGTAYGLMIICTSPVFYGNADPHLKETEYATTSTGSLSITIMPTYGDSLVPFVLLNTGDTWAPTGVMSSFLLQYTNKQQLLLIKDESGEWYYNEESPMFAQYYNNDTSTNLGLTYINEKYESALSNNGTPSEPESPPVYVQYMIDIPSIITAIPNGAKQIINNAFGFEIFGINVAGLLSAIIIIAIVAYAVKKMMTR